MDLLKDYYLEQLYNATPTEENMKALAMYIRAFKEDYISLVEGIEFVYTRSSIHHRLCLLYLINEILHTEKSQSGMEFKAELKNFLKKHFLSDKDKASRSPVFYKKFQSLQDIWLRRNIINFDDKYGLEEIVSVVTGIFYDKNKLVAFLDEVSQYYKSKSE